MRLLLIEDKAELCEILQIMFEKNNFVLDIASSGEAGYKLALRNKYSVIILDIILPGQSGIDTLGQLRSSNIDTPVLMLTAKDSVNDKISAFDMGADDYLVKPFEFQELLVRIRALSRRTPDFQNRSISFGNTAIDRDSLEVSIDGEVIKTTVKEAKTLEHLFLNSGKYVSKGSILHIISGVNRDININNVEVYIHRIRKKFPPEISGFSIETKQSLGYRAIEA